MAAQIYPAAKRRYVFPRRIMCTLFTNLVKPRNHLRWPMVLATACILSMADNAGADTVNLTSGPPFTFRSGSDLYVSFSVWNYAANNRGSNPYPTSVGLQLLGAEPSVSTLQAIPNSTGSYFGGYLLQGWLENTEGTASAPFSSPDASRLGLAPGSLLLSPGTFGTSNTPVAVIEADSALTLNLSEQIFGPDIANRGSSAIIHLRNLGSDLQVGLEGGYSLLSAISEPSISGQGSVTTSGVTRSLQVTAVPEPGSLALFAGAGLALAVLNLLLWRKRVQKG